ncbi:MAG: intermembrane transport protein PqiB, partial [Gammaproteobacteria bacterium]
ALADTDAARIESVSTRLDATLDGLVDVGERIDARVAPVADAAVVTLDEARRAIGGAGDVLAADSRTRYNLDRTLEELAGAARSLRIMAEFLEQHPDALIRGKDL